MSNVLRELYTSRITLNRMVQGITLYRTVQGITRYGLLFHFNL